MKRIHHPEKLFGTKLYKALMRRFYKYAFELTPRTPAEEEKFDYLAWRVARIGIPHEVRVGMSHGLTKEEATALYVVSPNPRRKNRNRGEIHDEYPEVAR